MPPFACLKQARYRSHVFPDLYGADLNVKFDNPDRKLTHGQANQLVPVDALQDPGQILDITFGVTRIGVSVKVKCYEWFPDQDGRTE